MLFHFVLWKLCAFGPCAGLPQDNLNLQTIFWLWKTLRGIIRDHEKQQDKNLRSLYRKYVVLLLKGIVSRDWGGLQMILLDRYIVVNISAGGSF